MQWHTQVGNTITNMRVKIYFTLPELSETIIVAWNCHLNNSNKGRYDIVLGLNLKLSEQVIKADDIT